MVIAAGSGFTHLWLLPQLPALKRAFPGFTFKLMPIDRADAPELQAANIAIRFGPYMPQEGDNCWSVKRTPPVCSPTMRRNMAWTIR